MSPAGDSQWETKHSSFLMQATVQITFQQETISPFQFSISRLHSMSSDCALFLVSSTLSLQNCLRGSTDIRWSFPGMWKYSKWDGNMTIMSAILDAQNSAPLCCSLLCWEGLVLSNFCFDIFIFFCHCRITHLTVNSYKTLLPSI